MGDAATITARPPARPFRSKRLLALLGDDRLVDQIRHGNELAFEVVFERHSVGILAFCRHMLGSREEAEDAVQQTFAAAHRDLERGQERRIALKPWLYTIARNRCVSTLRSRREQTAELHDLPTEGLSEQVERRAELRELLADLRELPEEQRAALLLAEAGGLSHVEVAQVLGCEAQAVKRLVFRARSGLIERREARATPCAEIREQLATLRGGALRRNELGHHLRHCPGCAAYREEVRRQRQMLGVALPVAPTVGLKSSVLAAVGVGGGTAGGGALAGSIGSAAVAKVALAGVLAGGGAVGTNAVVDRIQAEPAAPAVVVPAAETRAPAAGDAQGPPATTGRELGAQIRAERSHGRRGAERRSLRARAQGSPVSKTKDVPPGRAREAARKRSADRRGPKQKDGAPGRVRSLERRSNGGPPEAKPEAAPRPAPQPGPKPKVRAETPAPRTEPIVAPDAPAPPPPVVPAPDAGRGKSGK
jgi:RNA polymerase sigma factor (sigma-70 family)